MRDQPMLTHIEELMLRAVRQLGEAAYGASVRRRLNDVTGQTTAPGGFGPVLERLVDRGYLDRAWGAPRPMRGGRARAELALTPLGHTMLARMDAIRAALEPTETAPKLADTPLDNAGDI